MRSAYFLRCLFSLAGGKGNGRVSNVYRATVNLSRVPRALNIRIYKKDSHQWERRIVAIVFFSFDPSWILWSGSNTPRCLMVSANGVQFDQCRLIPLLPCLSDVVTGNRWNNHNRCQTSVHHAHSRVGGIKGYKKRIRKEKKSCFIITIYTAGGTAATMYISYVIKCKST